ncbi:MAG: YggT family protein [Desulfobacterales bacterium]|nr:YggT family protein [Desulfobacterales bacterium]
MGELIYNLAGFLDFALNIYLIIVIASAIISWVNPDPYNPIIRFLRRATDPVYYYIRKYLPFLNVGGLDLSPIVLILGIQFVQIFLIGSLRHFARTL